MYTKNNQSNLQNKFQYFISTILEDITFYLLMFVCLNYRSASMFHLYSCYLFAIFIFIGEKRLTFCLIV